MAQVKDVVCGMTIDSETAQFKSDYKGQTYYFCALVCKRSFDQDPEKYAGSQASHHGGSTSHTGHSSQPH